MTPASYDRDAARERRRDAVLAREDHEAGRDCLDETCGECGAESVDEDEGEE